MLTMKSTRRFLHDTCHDYNRSTTRSTPMIKECLNTQNGTRRRVTRRLVGEGAANFGVQGLVLGMSTYDTSHSLSAQL